MKRRDLCLGLLGAAAALAMPGEAHAQAPKLKPLKPAAPRAGDGDARPLAVVGATVYTGTGEVIQNGTVLLARGKIEKVGAGLAVPGGAESIDGAGLVVTPGLVDALTSLGLIEVDLEPHLHDDRQAGGEIIRAGFRAADGYNPSSAAIAVARSQGLTSAGVIPHGGLISGQSAWADLDGATAEEAIAASPLAIHVSLDAAAGGDRGGHATAILRAREAFDDARAFKKNRAGWERNQSRRFAASRLDLEALAIALDGKLPIVFHVDRAADILTALSLAKEFKLRPVIAGGAEAWKVAAALSAAKVPVLVDPFVQPYSFDALGAREDNAALLHAAGVPVGISTQDTFNARKLRQLAGNAVRSGLPHAAAIAAITRVPAEAMGMGARYGTLTAGKVGNLAVWSGDPLEIGTRLVGLVIRGRKVTGRSRQAALLDKYRTLPKRP